MDYYLANSTYYSRTSSGGNPGKNNSQYSQINLVNLTYAELYDWQVGDVYEYGYCVDGYCVTCCSATSNTYYLDTIVKKTIYPSQTVYNFSGWLSQLTIDPKTFLPYYKKSPNKDSLIYSSAIIIDTTLMPEEYKQQSFYYYYPNDTSFCRTGIAYNIYHSTLNGINFSSIEPFKYNNLYKQGLGLVDHEYFSPEAGPGHNTLIYYNRNDTICGAITTSVANIPETSVQINMYPNPANDAITISLPVGSNSDYNIEILNTMGQTVRFVQSATGLTTINVGALPAGIYNFRTTDQKGSRENQKIVVTH